LSPPNDWEIRRCLGLCLGMLLAALLLIELGSFNLDVPVLRQLVVLLFLALVPGILILRTFKIHNLGMIESLLYSVGLSMTFVMLIGVILNFALPPLSVLNPITISPLLIAITLAILMLTTVAYLRDKSFVPPCIERKDVRGISINPYLLAVMLPLVAVLGVSLVNSFQNNILIMVLILGIAIIIGLIAFKKLIPESIFPFLLVMIAIALIFQTTLLSNYLVGSDIHVEYYFAKLVSVNGYWNASIADSINSCLSIVILAPVYSLFLHTDIVWLFKIVYPLFFCLVPLTLFIIFRSQMGERYAFLAAFFFISLPMFFMDMSQLARQQTSELFFVLVVLLLVDRRLKSVQRASLILLFSFGIIVSYYGLGTGYVLGYLTLGGIVLIIIKSRPSITIWQRFVGRTNSLPQDINSAGALNKKTLAIIIGSSIVFMLAYYGIVASGAGASGLRMATGLGQSAIHGVGSFLNQTGREPLVQTAIGLDFANASALGKIWRMLQYLVQFCFIAGFFRLIFRPATLGKLKAEYISLTIVSVLILLAVFVAPSWSEAIGVTRVWQITLLIISPLFIFGGEVIVVTVAKFSRLLLKGFHSLRIRFDYQAFTWIPVIAVLLPYFIFNSGAVFELSHSQTSAVIDTPYSIVLSSYRLDLNTVFSQQDLAAADWICNHAKANDPVYADYNSSKLFLNKIDFPCLAVDATGDPAKIVSPGYFYLRAWNVEQNELTFATGYATRQSIDFDELPWFKQIRGSADTIYDSGGAQILRLYRTINRSN
jgi:uncharacterized membrane protein